VGERDWVEAGLLDPDSPDADDRRALLSWLDERGVTIEEMQVAARTGSLPAAATDRWLHPPGTMTREDVAERTGLAPEQVDRTWLAAGFPPPGPGERTFRESDLELFDVVPVAVEMFGADTLLAFTRVMGTSMARIAEAADAMFLADVEAPGREAGMTDLELAQTTESAVTMLFDLPQVLAPLFRRHAAAAIERSRLARSARTGDRRFTGPDRAHLAIGFADLVGFTEISEVLDRRALAEIVGRFERAAAERAVAAGARVVKSIGDAVMVVALDPIAVVDVLQGLIDDVAGEPELRGVRSAVVAGEVLARDGDYVGPTVNLAARATKEAEPGGLVVNDVVAEALHAADRPTEPMAPRLLRGIVGEVVLFRVGEQDGGEQA
jgi:adenylate cyclase